jgi:hypothetical protein
MRKQTPLWVDSKLIISLCMNASMGKGKVFGRPVNRHVVRSGGDRKRRRLGMGTDQICMKLDLDNTFYHIFTRRWIQIWIFLNIRIQNGCLEFGNTFSIYLIGRQHLPIFFIDNLQLENHVKTKVLLHNRDHSLRISHSSIFILIINHTEK